MNREKLKQAFQLFVGNDELRKMFHQPYKQEGYCFATDAHALIMCPDTPELDFIEQDKPKTLAVVPKERHEPKEVNIKGFAERIKAVSKLIPEWVMCNECNGNGYLECDLGHEHECEECEDGEILTNSGIMVPDLHQVYDLGEAWVAHGQIIKMVNACQLLGIDKVYKVAGTGNKALFFEAEDISFLVMPIARKDGEDEVSKVSLYESEVLTNTK